MSSRTMLQRLRRAARPSPCAPVRAFVGAALLAVAGATAAQNCNFRNPAPGDISFSPAFDPSLASTRTATTDVRVQCSSNASVAWTFSGSNGSNPLRMKHATQNAFIPYTVSAAYLSGPNNNQQWRLTATVLGVSYQDARVGSYSDILTATVLP